jgi:DNA-binding CsgD family transcriptional regulator
VYRTTAYSKKLVSTYSGLTPSEITIVNFIKGGARNKEIAESMNLSIRTVEFHRKNIRRKPGIKNKKTNPQSLLLSV